MQIVSQDTLVTVTFETPLAPHGVLDPVHYLFRPVAGGVPIAATVVADASSAPLESSIAVILIEVNKPTNGAQYLLEVRGLVDVNGMRYGATETFTASSTLPTVSQAVQLDEGQVLVTFSETMRIDSVLLSPLEYVITGPTAVLIKTVQTAAPNQVLLGTVGMAAGAYTLEVNASGTPHDIAGNPLDPTLNQAAFTGSPALASRSVFADHGPISKPELVLQSGASASIPSAVQLSLPGAALDASMVGLYLRLEGTANAGTYQIVTVVSGTVAKVRASFSIPDASDGSIGWSLVDPRDGEIADDPTDVTVRVNGAPVTPEAVIGLLGQVVLSSVPDPADTVEIDYCWVQNPVVDLRRLNSKEFRLNNWNRDNGRPTDTSAHKYRYNNTLIQPESFVALDMRAVLAQPQQRDLKYRAYERAYSVALNDPNLLLLNSPNHRIAFPPMSRELESTFVNYQGTALPEAVAVDPWSRHGVGQAYLSGNDLVVVDDSGGAFPVGEPIFWSRSLDLTFAHVFAIAWRMRIDAVPVADGVFTGVVAGYADAERAVVVGFLDTGSELQFGVLRRGYGNDPSTPDAWTGGLDSQGNATGMAVAIDWSVLRGYRIFRDRSGTISVYIDGAVFPSLRVPADELPGLDELNVPFDSLQGPFFGSLSREALSTSVWSFVRYTAIPINPLEAAPSVFVSYEGDTAPESADEPWTPVGFHGTETIVGDTLWLDSTSATDLPSATAAGLVSGDFRGYTRIEPLLSESFNTLLDLNVAVRTHTHGITPNALMAAIDDGDRLIQLCFLSDKSYPKLSYGGRSLPPDFAPYAWMAAGTQTATMVGQYLQVTDASTSDGLVYAVEDSLLADNPERVLGYMNDYMLECRVNVLSYSPDMVGFAGVMCSAYDSLRAVGLQLTEVSGQRYVELHSDGVGVAGGQFLFDWLGDFHTFRLVKSTSGDLVSLFVDTVYLGSVPYSSFSTPVPSLTGLASFGSATPLSMQATSTAQWAYANYWRVGGSERRFVGLWKGYDPEQLTGYHLPVSIVGRDAAVNGNVVSDPLADFVTSGVQTGDQLLIDDGPNKGVYTVQVVAPGGDVTRVTLTASLPSQPSVVAYRVVAQTDWSIPQHYRISKEPEGGVSVAVEDSSSLLGELIPIIQADYSNTSLPPSSVGLPQVLASGLPSVTWGAFDPTNLSQSSWDYVRLGAVRSTSAQGIVPHHQILNQRNVIASFEHHRTNVAHTHTDFWSESEGIPPQTEPDLLRDPNVIAFTLLNDSTPLVPSTQTYEVRTPTPVLVPVTGLNQPSDALNAPGFTLNDGTQRVVILVPDDVLYNSLQVIERSSGVANVLAPFDDESQPTFGSLGFQKEVCLQYDGSGLPENDSGASSPWFKASDDPSHQFSTAFGSVLTYGTDSVGTRTVYGNNTPLLDTVSLHTEVTFRLKLLQDSSFGLGDSQVRVGFTTPGVTVGLAFVTTPIGQRYVLAVDLASGKTVGGIAFDYYDDAYHDYRLVRDPATNSVQIFIDG